MQMIKKDYATTSDGKYTYEYIEVAPEWKKVCSVLPLNARVTSWPGYRTQVYRDVMIAGCGPLIIQPWKGWCQRFGGAKADSFPGGIGAEVGVYELIDPRHQDVWIPYTKKLFPLRFRLIHPFTKEIFFTSKTETSYWVTRWMAREGYKHYKDVHSLHPLEPDHFVQEFWVGDMHFVWN